MRLLTTELRWAGIGGPMTNFTEKGAFAERIKYLLKEGGMYAFERLRGATAQNRGPGASGFHINNVRLPEVHDQPTPFVTEE